MQVLQPFLDIIISLYSAFQAFSSAPSGASKISAALNFLGFAVYVPSAISNAPNALSAYENLQDADRQAIESYINGKLPGVSSDVMAKIVAGLDIALRGGAVVNDFAILFKSSTAAPVVSSSAAPAQA